jgi:hypothetical protein
MLTCTLTIHIHIHNTTFYHSYINKSLGVNTIMLSSNIFVRGIKSICTWWLLADWGRLTKRESRKPVWTPTLPLTACTSSSLGPEFILNATRGFPNINSFIPMPLDQRQCEHCGHTRWSFCSSSFLWSLEKSWRIQSFGMWRRVAVVITCVSEERIASKLLLIA